MSSTIYPGDSARVPPRRNLTILGSTGSIGISTLAVAALNPDRYRIFALAAHSSLERLFEQCCRFSPRFAVIGTPKDADELRRRLREQGCDTQVLAGLDGCREVASHEDCHDVMAAIVGAAGLAPTLAAVEAGKKVLLANKEALVMSGRLFMEAVERSGALLLPIDSEHNAIFQCLAGHELRQDRELRRVILTASGGPFRTMDLDQLQRVTPDMACNHPNWDMGRKISVDSATMMNKGLEIIEASWLFGLNRSQLEVVIHPQSIIHSMVEYRDGSVLAQMGLPDMRTPIAHALAWPERIDSGVGSLDFAALAGLHFEALDQERFPCFRLASQVLGEAASLSVALNAANEIAVDAFLEERIDFTRIAGVIETVLERIDAAEAHSLEVVLDVDASARALAREAIGI